ncbi:PREDICTED: spectrin beta chain, non-erythrocytic 5 [Myotis brandtii]|uniref:spectrin beta chain, non-erythrocytic 5 n=1 Tax=Myotis brandtii TaxID=109478 RepID=UPI0003BB6E55|nr:PREDICTED: spectrin beta chain, non-erythrocytic 5 [Myotis brandtii]
MSVAENLQDIQNFLEFLQREDHCEAWMQGLGVMVSLGDLGQNHEHCLPLLKQLRELQGVWAGGAEDDTTGAARTCRCLSRTGTPSKSRPSASGNTSSTAGQPQGGKQWAGEGAGGPAQTQPHILSARWHSFHGNLLRHQRQLEDALETHTLSCRPGPGPGLRAEAAVET